MSFTITEKVIKSKIKWEDKTIIIENIKYPHFESETHKKLCKKMNEFYSSVAERYSHHAKNKLANKIKLNISHYKLPSTIRMNYTAVLFGENIISVVLDLSFIQGAKTKARRFSQMWSIKNGDIFPLSELIKTDRKSRKTIFSYLQKKAEENSKNPAFGYVADYASGLSRKFSMANCFIVPNGVCFFINAGILAPVKYGAGNFVIPFSDIKALLKADFMSENAENIQQTSDIVNNI